jgi:hypothetical protein
VQDAGRRARDELAAVNTGELMESDVAAYNDAAVRVGASRWAELPAAEMRKGTLNVRTRSGQPGETCVELYDGAHEASPPLASRCTYGIVWTASASAHPQGKGLTLAVQPLDTWREMWVFRQGGDGWRVDVVPPSLDTGEAGYIEFAGWVPGTGELLAAREAKRDGRHQVGFEVLSLASLETKKQADKPGNLTAFYRWQDPAWKTATVAVR